MVIHATTLGFQPFKLYVSAILSFTFEHGESFFGSTFFKSSKGDITWGIFIYTLFNWVFMFNNESRSEFGWASHQTATEIFLITFTEVQSTHGNFIFSDFCVCVCEGTSNFLLLSIQMCHGYTWMKILSLLKISHKYKNQNKYHY